MSSMLISSNFLGTYDNDIEKIECAPASFMERDPKIISLSITVKGVKRFNNEEVQKLQAQVEESLNSLMEIEQRELALSDNQYKLKLIKSGKMTSCACVTIFCM